MSTVRHQRLVYGADGKPNDDGRRTFNVADHNPVLLTAAGLADGEVVPIYHRIGAGNTLTHGGVGRNTPGVDFVWAPVTRCGVPLALTADSSQVIERLPGVYMVGPPGSPPSFAGDVNITTRDLDREYLFVDPYCAGSGAGDVLDQSLCDPAVPLGVLASW